MIAVVGARVTVFVDGQPEAGSIVEVGLGTVQIRYGKVRPAWFHDLESARRPGVMMGDQTGRITYRMRDIAAP